MRAAIFGLVIFCLALGGAEVWFHGYAGTQNTPVARSMKDWYQERDSVNRKVYHASVIDFILPAITVGIATGVITARCSKRMFICSLFFMPLLVAGLYPFYAAVLPTKDSVRWWSYLTTASKSAMLFLIYLRAELLCLFFGGIGRACMRQYRHLPSDVP